MAKFGALKGEVPKFNLSVTRRLSRVVKDQGDVGANQTGIGQYGPGPLGDVIWVNLLHRRVLLWVLMTVVEGRVNGYVQMLCSPMIPRTDGRLANSKPDDSKDSVG